MSYDEDEYGTGFKVGGYDEEETTDEPLDVPEEPEFEDDDPEDRYH